MAQAKLETKITMDDSQFHAAIRRASQAAVAMASQMGSIFKGAAVARAAAMTAAIIGLAAAMGAAMNRAFELGGKFNDLAAQTGGAVGQLTLLETAFDNAGVGGDQLGAVINKLQKAVETGSPVFEKLGVSLTNLKEQTPDMQLETVGRAIAALKSPSEQTAAAMELFGKSGGKLLAVFKDGGALDSAKQVLGSMPGMLQENASLFDKIGDAIGNMGKKWDGFSVGLASQIAPKMESVIDKIISVDTAKIGEAMGKDIASAFLSPDIVTNISNIATAFVRVMSTAISSIGKLLTAGMLGAFAEPLATFQATLMAASAAAGAAWRNEVIEEVTPKDKEYATEIRGEIDERQADLKQRSGNYLAREKQTPGYSNTEAGKRDKADLSQRSQTIQDLTKLFSEVQTRINNARQYDPDAIKEDLMSRGGARFGMGEGKNKEELVDEALKDIKATLSQEFPNSLVAAVTAINAFTGSASQAGVKLGALAGVANNRQSSGAAISSDRRSTGIRRYDNLQKSASPWEVNKARQVMEQNMPDPQMLGMAGFGMGNIANLAAQNAKAGGQDSVVRAPSKLAAGVRKRGETKEDFKDRMAGVQKGKEGEQKEGAKLLSTTERIAKAVESW